MTQVHIVIRRINPALKIDLVQVGYIEDGQFAIMPVTGKVVFDQDQRASWFSHKAEVSDKDKVDYYTIELTD